MTDTSASLQPGAVIRPVIDPEGVQLLAERLYGISVLELTELNGYDDRNFRITEDPNVKNPLITTHSQHGYVLKIMNSMDSQNVGVVEAQNEIMNFLNARGVVCPKPVRNVYGHLHSIETLNGQRHAVRLLEYVPGELLKDVPKTEALFYQLGEFVANLDNKLQNFNHSGLVSREHIWMLTKVPELDQFKSAVKEQDKLELAEEVIEEFKYAVVPRLDELERGVIHGDVNEMNILVAHKPGGSESDYRICGIIDFGDIQYSYYVFELAIAMTYVMLITGDPKDAGFVLAGYTVNRRLPDDEYRLLKTLISSRLVQSLVLGAYTREQDPNNTYVSSTEKANGWELLRKLRKSKPEVDDPTDWKTIANEYLTRS
ncbi:hydroxylysine kinase [Plodia interpunctella]|uniref:hydroxylysine kinase n=1 Tax=Plodia interpunctella TaxID=58824 RepID=UPI002367A8F2|nr:hydroxylysine kinase [Plodia interpunctella]XP_053620460.1 hydroxylysine kinase [Plodia interpunctella]XP_053620461.1 hydroxylysine kinase [Plodia interpunctella]